MIPKVMPPLSGLTVLVTRPAAQSGELCKLIQHAGGEALALPAIDIEPLQVEPAEPCDLAIFASVNAVAHGAHLVADAPRPRIAAIGKATAAALKAVDVPVDIVPASGFTSESLLSHPDLNLAPGSRVLIVRGVGGRQLMRETFTQQGMQVRTREVYRRVLPAVDPAHLAAIEARWRDGEIDAVTVTSVETLNNLHALLSEAGRELLHATLLVVSSPRIRDAAHAAGCQGEILVAASAEDAATVGALARWFTRARSD